MTGFYRITGTLAGISTGGALLIILSYLLVKDLRRHPLTMVFWLAVCDFGLSLKYLFISIYPGSEALQYKPEGCLLEAIFSQFFGMASISWTGILSFNILFSIKYPFKQTATLEKWYHLYVWSLSALTTLVLSIDGGKCVKYGPNDGTCWVIPNRYTWLFFGPLILYVAISCGTVVLAVCRTSLFYRASDYKRKLMIRMVVYVGMFVLVWSGSCANGIYKFVCAKGHFSKDNYCDQRRKQMCNSTPLNAWDAFGVSLQGFVNAIIWLTNPGFLKTLKSALLRKFAPWRVASSDKVPLLPDVRAMVDDNDVDWNDLNISLRKNMLSSMLLGINSSLDSVNDSESTDTTFTEKHFKEKRKHHLHSKNLKESLSDLEQSNQDVFASPFIFLDYAPTVFRGIRLMSGVTDFAYKRSLKPSAFMNSLMSTQKFSDGRSGSFFCLSPDKKFIIKTIPNSEMKVLRRILPSYFRHLESYPNSLLTRFYGAHMIDMSYGEPLNVIVMSNVLDPHYKIEEIFDLKGSWIDRGGGSITKGGVGKDKDLKRSLQIPKTKRADLLNLMEKDSQMLCDCKIMDYSLLLGICPKADSYSYDPPDSHINEAYEELIVSENNSIQPSVYAPPLDKIRSLDNKEIYLIGIIDFLQSYNIQKKIERCCKVCIACKDKDGISAQSPLKYRVRFLKKMKEVWQSDDFAINNY
eukprot:TRINITY_DN7587_c0_g1_i1.p1 TRINITY_DN7587_c0_g1~~TRINITY_DN7587_c0_g1_i1.p1  ORF type:complete len:692 (-),score=84.07 TRINITY_DN7587_c0_g1_i1:5-2080(-)